MRLGNPSARHVVAAKRLNRANLEKGHSGTPALR